jgi:hypothetical protein
MKIQTIICAAFIFTACNNPQTRPPEQAKQTSGKDKPAENHASGADCFLRTEGDKNQDSTKIQLNINGDVVRGTMIWLPAEKDSRRGKLNGTIIDGVIKASWTYMQEGMENTLPVEFMLEGESLKQKKSKYDNVTGEESLDEKSDYELHYQRVECH